MSTESTQSTQIYTCLSCQVAFTTAQDQRKHMTSDWHRYNLKRKVADLPPVPFNVFASKLQQIQSIPTVEASEFECIVCKKSYNSQNSYFSHLESKKHKENALKNPILDSVDAESSKEKSENVLKKTNWQEKLLSATSEAELDALLKEKESESVILKSNDCLFCPTSSESLEDNVDHMTRVHSFFIPDIEYLVDLQGLLEYLGRKISVANVCIYCNGKGRAFYALDAVRDHMISKGHCKIQYEDDADLEIAEFYDFSDTWEDLEEDIQSEILEEEYEFVTQSSTNQKEMKSAEISQDGSQLMLPNGLLAGHRSLRIYYKQNLKPVRERDSGMIHRLKSKYKSLGYSNNSILATKERQKQVIAHEKQMIIKKQLYHQQQEKFRIGMKHNSLQSKYFRNQLLQ